MRKTTLLMLCMGLLSLSGCTSESSAFDQEVVEEELETIQQNSSNAKFIKSMNLVHCDQLTVQLAPDFSGKNNVWGDPEESTTKVTIEKITITSENGDVNYVIAADASASTESSIDPAIAEPLNHVTRWKDLAEVGGIPKDEPIHIYDDAKVPAQILNGTSNLKATVHYYVRTRDRHLQNGYTEVEQTLTKSISRRSNTEGGDYNLNLVIGLNAIQFSATVSDFEFTDF